MSVWRRAFLYVTRKRMRSILLFVIFFLTGLFLLAGLVIRESADSAAQEFRKSLAAGITINWQMRTDLDSFVDCSTNEKGEFVAKMKIPMMKEEYIDDFLAMDGACGFYCETNPITLYTGLTVRPGFNTDLFGLADGTAVAKSEDDRVYVEWMEELKQQDNDLYLQEMNSLEARMHTNQFIMVYDSRWHPAFVNGAVELEEGRHVQYGDEHKTLISAEVAEKNHLKVGDTVSALNYDFITGEKYGSEFELEIVGIFRVNFDQKLTEWTMEQDILENMFFCTWDINYWSQFEYNTHYMRTVIAKESEPNIGNMVLFVEDPMYLESVKEQLLAFGLIDWDSYDIGIYDEDYQAVAKPLLTMEKLSGALVFSMALGALCILSLVLTLWIRSRNYEAGIFSSVGIKKKEVALQFVLEVGFLAVLAFFASALFAKLLAGPMGDGFQALIESFYSSGSSHVVAVDQSTSIMQIRMQPVKGKDLSYAVTGGKLCTVFLLLLATAAVSTILASRQVLRKKPWEILGRR